MQKPKLIRHEKGKLIYAIDGYVEFMNISTLNSARLTLSLTICTLHATTASA